MLSNIIEQSLLFFPLSLGLYISYTVLKVPDLTTDGSFVLGAALLGLSIHFGLHPLIGMLLATLGGVSSGVIVSILQTRFHVQPLISGILLVFVLHTLTLSLMGKPNLSLVSYPSIFSLTKMHSLTFLSLLTVVLFSLFSFFLTSKVGLMLYAVGSNPSLLNLCGKSASLYRTLGLSISNGLVAFSGGLTAQANGFVDITMGTGIVLIALGTVVIGKQVFQFLFSGLPLKRALQLLSCLFGIVIYFSLIYTIISLGLDPIYLRLMIGVCLIGFLAITHKKHHLGEVL